jgi:uncharacterized membrane protein YkvA (DUF1232 family)
MPWLIRIGALVALWAGARLAGSGDSPHAQRISSLSWTAKARLTWNLLNDERVPVLTRGLMLLPALYIASPIDILPDFIPVLGRLDDGMVFGLVSKLMMRFGVPNSLLDDHLDRVEGIRRA